MNSLGVHFPKREFILLVSMNSDVKENRLLRIGIIGAGWWAAATHVPALRATGHVEITAACRRSPEALAEFAEKVGVQHTFTNHEEMLDSVELDAVIVCSPHALHYTHVKAALERGLPTLTDKPMAIHTQDAEELVALAEKKQVPLAVFFGHAYDSSYRYAAQLLRQGTLGRPAYLSSIGFANPDALGFFGNAEFLPNPEEFPIVPTQFRADATLGGGGYLQDVGNHHFSGLLINTGLTVASVSAMMDNVDLDLRTVVNLRFTNGAVGTVLVAGDMYPPNARNGYWASGQFSITGDLGTLWRHSSDGALRIHLWGESPREVNSEEMPQPTNPDANFIAHLRGEAELIAPGSQAVHCVRVIEAAYHSAKTGETVHLV